MAGNCITITQDML